MQTFLRSNDKNVWLTINPLYQALICCLVKLVLSMRNVMSSLDSFLLDFPPIFLRVVCVRRGICSLRGADHAVTDRGRLKAVDGVESG